MEQARSCYVYAVFVVETKHLKYIDEGRIQNFEVSVSETEFVGSQLSQILELH